MCKSLDILIICFQKIFSIDFVYRWQELIGAFLGVSLPLLVGFLGYFWKKRNEKSEKRKHAIQMAEIYITQSWNESLMFILQIEAFLERIETLVADIKSVSDESSYFLGSTNFPPIAEIEFNESLLQPGIGSYYLHNKMMKIKHILKLTNNAVKKFDIDYTNLLARNEENTKRVKPSVQRNQYTQDLKGYSNMVQKVLSDLKNIGMELLAQAKIYNLKLMKNYKGAKKAYEEEEMDLSKMEKIDHLIKIEVEEMMSGMNF